MKQKYLAIAILLPSLIYSVANAETASPQTPSDTQQPPTMQPPSNGQQLPPPPAPQQPQGSDVAPDTSNPVLPRNRLRNPPNNRQPNQTNQSNSNSSNEGIQGTGAEGGTRMTVIDENGNLKMVEVPRSGTAESAGTSRPSTTTPGMNQSAPTGQAPAPQPMTPGMPTDSNTMRNAPQPAAPPSPQNEPTTPSAPSGMEPPLPLNNPATDDNLNNINEAVQ